MDITTQQVLKTKKLPRQALYEIRETVCAAPKDY